MAGQGIEVRVAATELRASARSFPAGSIVVPLAQPGRPPRAKPPGPACLDGRGLREGAGARRKKRLPDEIYDVTAWSLPLVFDVECTGASVLNRTDAAFRGGGGLGGPGSRGGEGGVAPPVGLGPRRPRWRRPSQSA